MCRIKFTNYRRRYLILSGLFYFSLTHANATSMFIISNDNPYLNISFEHQIDTPSAGPSDFVVFKDTIAVLDSDGNQISFFDETGKYLKKIKLPAGYYQRLIKDRNHRLYACVNNGLSTTVIEIDGQGLQQKSIEGNLDKLMYHALIDDFGLFFEKNNITTAALGQVMHHEVDAYRINRDCFACGEVHAKHPMVNGVSYQLQYQNTQGDQPRLMIGDKAVALNQQLQNAGTRIEQIDPNGTVWVEQSVLLLEKVAKTYVLKILVSGEIEAVYALPSIHPDDYVAHQIAISDKGELWFMRGMQKGLVFERLKPLPGAKNLSFLISQALPLKKKLL